MHDCPACGEVCYCDLDDSNNGLGGDECVHNCELEEEIDGLDDGGGDGREGT